MCVWCVCVRERERERVKQETFVIFILNILPVTIMLLTWSLSVAVAAPGGSCCMKQLQFYCGSYNRRMATSSNNMHFIKQEFISLKRTTLLSALSLQFPGTANSARRSILTIHLRKCLSNTRTVISPNVLNVCV